MTALERPRQFFAAHPLAIDVALVAAVTLVAALLRLIRLGDIPYGVHPDEAQIGLDAFRISRDHWIGVYSHAALGVPTLNAYIDWPGIWLLGHTAFSLRLPLALVGLAAVPLLYVLVRVAYGRLEAFFAALLLGVSYWHLFYSRVAHSSISYPTIMLAALLCLMLGLTQRRLWWFVPAGFYWASASTPTTSTPSSSSRSRRSSWRWRSCAFGATRSFGGGCGRRRSREPLLSS